MSGLRPPSTPRSTAPTTLPAPGSTPSSLPTPRRKSNAAQLGRPIASTSSGFNKSSDAMNSLQDAMKRNDPGSYDSPDINGSSGLPRNSDNSPTPSVLAFSTNMTESKRKLGLRRPSMANIRPNLSKSLSRPATPSSSASNTFTIPRTPTHPRSKTPVGFGSSTAARTSTISTKRLLEVGDAVKMEVGGVHMEGVVRFLGEVAGKEGNWGGVELDAEWAGEGKNDGSVKGDQYFACPPMCGLFLPLAKISPTVSLLRQSRAASSMSTHSDVTTSLTAGSRDSKYLGVTAKELEAQRVATSPTKATPRKSISPEKLSLSKSLGMSTPRATIRGSRPSIGGLGSSSTAFSTPRAAVGGTPRVNLGASLRRPPSSLRNHAPDVPAIPSTFAGGRSVSSSISGRATPSTPGGRRLSTATMDSSLSHSRPATPSMRSVSRQSFASSLSRQSHISYGDDAEDLREAREKESEMRKLLEGSERLGREMEDKMAETEDALKAASTRIKELESEKERNRALEEARLAEAGDEGAKERDLLRIRALEEEKESLQRQASTSKVAADKLAREWETKLAVRQGDIDSLRERMAEAAKDGEQERLELSTELNKLRGAGQALCTEYEERISGIEGARQESVELAESLALQLTQLSESISGSPVPSNRFSVSQTSSHTSAADIIDAENALAELEHTKSRLANAEEMLEEARMQLELEIAESKKKKQKLADVEAMWRNQTKTLREKGDDSNARVVLGSARISELEAALAESQRALEEERSEVEGLRHDANGSSLDHLTSDYQRTNQQLKSLTADRDQSNRELEELRQGLERSTATVAELREDLRMADVEIARYHASRGERSGSMASSIFNDSDAPDGRRDRLASLRLDNNTPIQQSSSSQDAPNFHTSPNGKRDSVISTSSRGGKDEATATREQIVGLKMIISTLTEENQQMADRNKSLMNESQELRDAQRALEATVDNLMSEMGNASPSNASKERRASSDLLSSVPLQREVDALKQKLDESDSRSQNEIKALNQEVTDLEMLIESKIFREEELETELARYKSLSVPPAHESLMNGSMGDDPECEMCGEKGHDLDACPIFGGVESQLMRNSSLLSGMRKGDSSDFCDDCEEYGHTLEACPLANEIF